MTGLFGRLAATAALIGAGWAGTALAAPLRYPTPEAAAQAVAAALEARDRAAVLAIFGPESEDVISTGDDAQDREIWSDFLTAWRAMHRVMAEADTAELLVGRDLWPFPIRIVRGTDGQWAFDAEGAREAIRLRRIGRNELDVIELLEAYVRVQGEFRRTDWDGDGVLSFAARIHSTPGARDGLYWPASLGEPLSPVGDFMARAAAEGTTVGSADDSPEPYLGYYFRILRGQTDAAPGGAMDYRVNGLMLAGHALLAWPAIHGETGITSFMVGEAGRVFEADLGEATAAAAAAITLFDPAAPWSPVAP